MTKAYEAKNLLLPGVRHGFFTRIGGASHGIYEGLNVGLGSSDERDTVLENRRRAILHLGEEAVLVTPYQVHRTDVLVVDKSWTAEDRPDADALVTQQPGIVLGIVTADCVPVLFADAEAGVIGAAHAGWKGALNGIVERTVAIMEKESACRPNIAAAIGPAISQASYEVGPELKQAFVERDAGFEAFFKSNAEGRFQFDLVGFVDAALKKAGIESVAVLPNDTYSEPCEFYSYRRSTHAGESDYGRQLSAIIRV